MYIILVMLTLNILISLWDYFR